MCEREKSKRLFSSLWEKMKPILPSLREKKRYMVFKIISDKKIGFDEAKKAIKDQAQAFMGEMMLSGAGLSFMDAWDEKNQIGIIRVNHKHLDQLRATLCLIKNIWRKRVIIRSLGVSGILKKTKRFVGG